MVKMIICLRRRPDLTPESLRQHWRDIHAAVVANHATTLGIKRYVQVHALEAAATAGRPEGFDGIRRGVDREHRGVRRGGRRAVTELSETDAFLTDLSHSPRTFGTEIRIFG